MAEDPTPRSTTAVAESPLALSARPSRSLLSLVCYPGVELIPTGLDPHS